MGLRLFGCVCGHLHSSAEAMGLMGGGDLRSPMPFYVIEHPEGVALFDCGLHADMLRPQDSYRRRLAAQGLVVELPEAELPVASLARLDIDPADVRWVVLSHLHFDHAGGLHQLPNAELVVQRREWEAGFDADMAARYGLPRRFFDLGHPVRLIEGEHDLFGDGSVTCLPSFGHTPGHQSLRVRSEAGDHILVADACYSAGVIQTRSFPSYSDAAAMNRALDRLLALREPETVMIFGHDAAQWGAPALLPSRR